jgi:hypothetical protein
MNKRLEVGVYDIFRLMLIVVGFTERCKNVLTTVRNSSNKLQIFMDFSENDNFFIYTRMLNVCLLETPFCHGTRDCSGGIVTRLGAENHRNLREEQELFSSPHCLVVGPLCLLSSGVRKRFLRGQRNRVVKLTTPF